MRDWTLYYTGRILPSRPPNIYRCLYRPPLPLGPDLELGVTAVANLTRSNTLLLELG